MPGDRFGLATLGLVWQRLFRRMSTGKGLRISSGIADRLAIAPPDLHTGDPTAAREIYSGIYTFAGRQAIAATGGPFRIRPPSESWLGELHSFTWLRHLDAARNSLSASNARALILDWIELHGKPRSGPAWQAEIAAQRLISWLTHSVMIAEGADIGFYREFLRIIAVHVRYLGASTVTAPDGMPRLLAAIALAYASISLSGKRLDLSPARKHLDAELRRQLLPDGGHFSRNAALLPEIAALLLPLRQSMTKLGLPVSPELVSAIDRSLQAIRFHRLGGGALARFNGVCATPNDLLATVLRYNSALGPPPSEAPHSGYQRLTLGTTCILVDAGKPPRGEASISAHAGCLSFEMSVGQSPLIVNCGAGAPGTPAYAAGRATAAHSTAVINDHSSCRFQPPGRFAGVLANQVVSGPQNVSVSRQDDAGFQRLAATHDGYLRSFGLFHERKLQLEAEGRILQGLDRFFGASGRNAPAPGNHMAAIRFHLHPAVTASLAEKGVILETPQDGQWLFSCASVAPEIEPSIHFGQHPTARKTMQIVLHTPVAQTPQVIWRIARVA